MKKSGRLPRRSPMKKRGRVKPVNASRRAREFARCYGSEERVLFVKSLPCCVRQLGAVHWGAIENVHTKGGGTGRKADCDTIVPMCHHHHRLLHETGATYFQAAWWMDLESEAARIDALWHARQAA